MEYQLWRKYCKKYISLVKSSQIENEELMEKHHIFPQSIFGKNKRVVSLTPRHHFVAHKLLHKIFLFRNGGNSTRCFKMAKAFCWMQTRNCVQFNSRRYEFCKKMRSESMRGQNNPFKNSESFSVEHRTKISESLLKNHPMKGKKHSDETKSKISKSLQGRTFIHSEETKRKISEKNKGREISEKTKIAVSESNKKRKGSKRTIETKEKMRNAQINKPKVKCPYCNTIGHYAAMGRWHFNNCKSK
jgi:hypothetical protein